MQQNSTKRVTPLLGTYSGEPTRGAHSLLSWERPSFAKRLAPTPGSCAGGGDPERAEGGGRLGIGPWGSRLGASLPHCRLWGLRRAAPRRPTYRRVDLAKRVAPTPARRGRGPTS
jgi:hypothetical protein